MSRFWIVLAVLWLLLGTANLVINLTCNRENTTYLLCGIMAHLCLILSTLHEQE